MVFNLGFMKACMMGREKVVKLLLENSDNIPEMIDIKDSHKTNGFMLACKWGKSEVVSLLVNHSVTETEMSLDDVYSGFKLACTREGYKVIPLILENKTYLSHIWEKEKENVVINEFKEETIRVSVQCNVKYEIVVNFDEITNPIPRGVKCKLEGQDEQDKHGTLVQMRKEKIYGRVKQIYSINPL